ncbi:MAG TPA: flagellar hook-length control protein FliK [Conexibacter sp.]|jgi:flagellar hook-length control protein FliK|nr:flagellar hook-length control protein FliK [Conexibacter sp.]
MTQISGALLQPPATSSAGKEPPGGSPPDTPFATVLDDHQARTAVAEGHQQKRRDAARGPAVDGDGREHAIERDGDDAGDEGKAPADPTSTEASALAALLGGVPLPAGVKLTALAMATGPQGGVPATAGTPAAGSSGTAVLPTIADGPALPMPTGPSVPAAATALPLRPPVPATTVGADPAVKQPIPTAAATSTAAARATRLADVLQAATARPANTGASASTPTPDTAATPPAATVAGAAARSFNQASDQGATNGSASQPVPIVTAQPAATAPTQSATPVAAMAPTHGVGLEHAVETVRLALRAAADRGITHARISLTPRELGSIEVHLRQTADGLVARVVAEHATAAQLLHNAGGELRRQLESQGLTLLRLDIGASGEQGGRPGDRALANGGGFGDDAGSGRNRSGDADPLAPLDGTAETSTTTTLTLPNGALVDVLA